MIPKSIRALAKVIQLFANLVGFGYVAVVLWTWIGAWLNGGYTIVTINQSGEAVTELILWAVMLPVIFFGVYMNIKDFVRMRVDLRRILLGEKKINVTRTEG